MRDPRYWALALATGVLLLACFLPAVSPAKAPAIEDDKWPVVIGRVTLEGDKPDLDKLNDDLRKIMKDKDETHCLAENASDDEKSQQIWKINDKGGVANVFVWLMPAKGER